MTDSLRSLAPEGRLLVLGFAAREISTGKVVLTKQVQVPEHREQRPG